LTYRLPSGAASTVPVFVPDQPVVLRDLPEVTIHMRRVHGIVVSCLEIHEKPYVKVRLTGGRGSAIVLCDPSHLDHL
jgi:hypothetical protein